MNNAYSKKNEAHFKRVRDHLETLPDAKAKIGYLIKAKTEYSQNTFDGSTEEILDGIRFDMKCKIEISKIERLSLLEQSPSQQTETNTGQVKPSFEKILTEIEKLENKFWKGLPMEQVINHFEVMTKKKNKTGNVYLTVEQLISFLKKGFLNDQAQPKQKINCVSGEKGFVIKRFYEFFSLAVSQYGHPREKEKFINLFNDCFDNWDQKTIKSFFKPNKTIEKW